MKSLPQPLTVSLFAGLILLAPMSLQGLELLAYYDFNGQLDDQSGNGAPAMGLSGNAVLGAAGSGALGDAGDGALDLGGVISGGTGGIIPAGPHFATATTNNSIAICFWQFNSELANSTSFWAINDGIRSLSAHVPWGDANIYFDSPARHVVPSATAAITPNQWNHFVLQQDASGNKEIWKNGVRLQLDTGLAAVPTFNGIMSVGAHTDDGVAANLTENVTGRMDEFAVFDDVLTEAQISLLATGIRASKVLDTTDSDIDGLLDNFEQLIIDADPDDTIETIEDVLPDDDFDMDGLSNVAEHDATTDPTDEDSDDDGANDGIESNLGIFVDAMTDIGTDPKNPDTDGDGLLDAIENPRLMYLNAAQPGTDPNSSDTDGDTYPDKFEIDNDSDPTDAEIIPSVAGLFLLAYYDFDVDAEDKSDNDAPVVILRGSATLGGSATGHSGGPNDGSLDLGATVNDVATGGMVDAGQHFDAVTVNNEIAVSFWQYNTAIGDSTSFWAMLDSSSRAFSAHVPWGDDVIYFDSPGRNSVAHVLETEEWNHFVFQKDSLGEKQIWKNGLLIDSWGSAGDITAFDGRISIGAEVTGANLQNNIAGRMDEFAVWSLALSPEEIGALAQGVAPPDLLNPQSEFKITQIVLGANGRATITFNAAMNQTYAIEVSTDAVNWIEISDNVIGINGAATYTDNQSDPTEPKLFYRVRKL